MALYKVTGVAPIQGIDGETVQPGGTVDLDPDVANVDVLVLAGCVEPVPEKASTAKPKE